MSDEEFNRLLNGPLRHPLPMFSISRLAIALRVVINATGDVGANALRDHCAERDCADRDEVDSRQE
jgi:hypothetical protein